MLSTFEDKVCVVTGAASGIGRALAERFAAERMKLVLADVEEPALAAAVAELAEGGADVVGVPTDVSQSAAVEALADRTLDEFGGVHLVCNNAGVESGGPFAEIPLEVWDWVLGVNFHGVLHGCRTFLPLLEQQEEAHIVNTCSISALLGFPETSPPYVVSKFAVLGLSETLHHALRTAGSPVGVSVLCAGFVDTKILYAERNRPASVPSMDEHPGRKDVIAAGRAAIAEVGLPPSRIAEDVFGAVRDDRFYVLSDVDEATAGVAARVHWMTTNEPPPAPW